MPTRPDPEPLGVLAEHGGHLQPGPTVRASKPSFTALAISAIDTVSLVHECWSE